MSQLSEPHQQNAKLVRPKAISALHKSLDAPDLSRKSAAPTNIRSSWRPGGAVMRRSRRIVGAAATALAITLGSHLALAQKSGGVLKMPDFASPASMSIHEEVTRAAVTVLMPVFNNLVLFDQHKEKNTLDTIIPDLAESWTWSEDGKELTFKLRHGVKWHDGNPFTAADVKCTWDTDGR